MRHRLTLGLVVLALAAFGARADYVNFESSHVHPIALTPSGARLLAVNTPDALLEVFDVQPDGGLQHATSIPVGLEPVTVVARTETEAWVVNHLSDSVSIVDLASGAVTSTLEAGDEPTDVTFAQGRAFVAVSQEDAVKVWSLANLAAAPTVIPLFGRDVRALDVSPDGATVYAVVLRSGNGTSVIQQGIVHGNIDQEDPGRLAALGLRSLSCEGIPPGTLQSPQPPAPYPPLPAGITRNPALPPPPLGNPPRVSLIVRWNESNERWEDETGTDWSHCLPYRPADDDLFLIDATSLGVSAINRLGTSLFEVSVHPSGKIYVPHTEARNFIPSSQHATEGSGRFEHLAGVRGRPVDNRMAVIDPSNGHAVTQIDLNAHIDRSTTPGPLAERQASVSQPGMLVWNSTGDDGFLTAIGSHKLFRVDGACLADGCVFGATRATPETAVVGEGPTGVALLEDVPTPGTDRAYVLNRIDHSISVVEVGTSSMTALDEIPLHDPSTVATKAGRRFLYDALDLSGHGDASCASCHLSGDMDGLSWELGNPEGDFVPYDAAMDNVLFMNVGGSTCDPDTNPNCGAATGFDPQKGPMVTQSLRGMLEPLHWRGDRPTMREFAGAFHELMGTADPLPAPEMEAFRQFALEIAYPPNPYRLVDDTMPNTNVQVAGMLSPGNPTTGENAFNFANTDGGGPCVTCHTHPFGAGDGVLGGVEPTHPPSPAVAKLFNGALALAIPNDVKISHLRNMYERAGAVWSPPGPMTCGNTTAGVCDNDPGRGCSVDRDCSHPETKTTFGFVHDGTIPDLGRFLSANVFTVTPGQIQNLVAFMFHFPTGTKPSVGRQVTMPAGAPPTGTAPQEQLLTSLVGLGDLTNPGRHCELVASTIADGRARTYHLAGGGWVTDALGEPPLTLAALRQGATAPITFTCVTLGSGVRLGGDRDEDGFLNGDECAPADPLTWAAASTVDDLRLAGAAATSLDWSDQSPVTGPSQRYDVLGGDLDALRASGLDAATSCVDGALEPTSWLDPQPAPLPGTGRFYLIRATNPCGSASLGPGRAATAACP